MVADDINSADDLQKFVSQFKNELGPAFGPLANPEVIRALYSEVSLSQSPIGIVAYDIKSAVTKMIDAIKNPAKSDEEYTQFQAIITKVNQGIIDYDLQLKNKSKELSESLSTQPWDEYVKSHPLILKSSKEAQKLFKKMHDEIVHRSKTASGAFKENVSFLWLFESVGYSFNDLSEHVFDFVKSNPIKGTNDNNNSSSTNTTNNTAKKVSIDEMKDIEAMLSKLEQTHRNKVEILEKKIEAYEKQINDWKDEKTDQLDTVLGLKKQIARLQESNRLLLEKHDQDLIQTLNDAQFGEFPKEETQSQNKKIGSQSAKSSPEPSSSTSQTTGSSSKATKPSGSLTSDGESSAFSNNNKPTSASQSNIGSRQNTPPFDTSNTSSSVSPATTSKVSNLAPNDSKDDRDDPKLIAGRYRYSFDRPSEKPSDLQQLADDVRDSLIQYGEHMQRPRKRLVERVMPELGDSVPHASLGVEELDPYYKATWNYDPEAQKMQLADGFKTFSEASYPAEHFGKALGFDPTGLSMMEILKEFESTDHLCETADCPIHMHNNNNFDSIPKELKEPIDEPVISGINQNWQEMLSNRSVPKLVTKRPDIKSQRINGRQVFGPEVPPDFD